VLQLGEETVRAVVYQCVENIEGPSRKDERSDGSLMRDMVACLVDILHLPAIQVLLPSHFQSFVNLTLRTYMRTVIHLQRILQFVVASSSQAEQCSDCR
jgi:hypothetical protein